MRHVHWCFPVLLAVLPVVLADGGTFAQQQAATTPQPVFGQVSGHVYCQDNGLPARFAGVQLLPEKPQQSTLTNPATPGKNADFSKVMANAMAAMIKGSNLSTVTEIDGSFSLDKVPPGTYYVIPQLPGYRSPLTGLSQIERMKAAAKTVGFVESFTKKIVVTGGTSTSVNLELERGATLSGKVAYDDGSPAPGVTPTLLMLQKDGKWKELQLSIMPVITDDRGRFRFYGLLAGKYAVKATLPVSQSMAGLGVSSLTVHINPGDALVMYNDGAMREEDIKPIEVGDGVHIDGIEVIFPLNGLHRISGSVVAEFDKHAVNSGTVELDDPDTKTPMRTGMVSETGTFTMNYVPEGSYVLKVTSAADTEQKSGDSPATSALERMLNSRKIRSYGTTEIPLGVKGDVNGLVLQVPDRKQ